MSLYVTAICSAVLVPVATVAIILGDPPRAYGGNVSAAAEGASAYDRLVGWLREELQSDWAAMRRDGARNLLKVPETLLALGLTVRASTHIAAYLLANPGGKPRLAKLYSADPIEARRPAWNVWTARLACCVFGAWLITVSAEFQAGANPVIAALAAGNVLVLVADPVSGILETHSPSTKAETTTNHV